MSVEETNIGPASPAPQGDPAANDFVPAHRPLVHGDFLLEWASRLSGVLIILMLAALVAILFWAARLTMHQFGWHFLVSSEWRVNEVEVPVHDANGHVVKDEDGDIVTQTLEPTFGALPVIYGTAVSSALSLVVAVPLSFGAALVLVRVARGRFVPIISFLIEFLAAIPSIAYGIWGLFVLAPFLQAHFEPAVQDILRHLPWTGWLLYDHVKIGGVMVQRPIATTGRDMLCGSLVLAVMIVPIITAISRDVLAQVPRAQIEGTVALGSTWWESCKEMLKFSRSGLFGAVMLGLARAAGETMAIAMVIGNSSEIRASLFAPAQTMSSLLANEFAEASTDLHVSALCEVALILLIMSLLFNVIARWLVVGGDSRGARAA
jgi:phosphate transport system permease protein